MKKKPDIPYWIRTATDGAVLVCRGRREWRVGSPDDIRPKWPLQVQQSVVKCLSAGVACGEKQHMWARRERGGML